MNQLLPEKKKKSYNDEDCLDSKPHTSHVFYAINHGFQHLWEWKQITTERCKQKKMGKRCCMLQTKQWHHTVDHTLSPFPPHLDLAWFNPLAELKEGSFCFVHVVQHHKTLPGDVFAAQGFLYLLAQGRRIRHILVVLRDLPTQDHMAAAVHLEGKQRVKGQRVCKWEREEALQNLQPPLLIFANAGSTIRKIKADGFTRFPSQTNSKRFFMLCRHNWSSTWVITVSLMAPPTLSK